MYTLHFIYYGNLKRMGLSLFSPLKSDIFYPVNKKYDVISFMNDDRVLH